MIMPNAGCVDPEKVCDCLTVNGQIAKPKHLIHRFVIDGLFTFRTQGNLLGKIQNISS